MLGVARWLALSLLALHDWQIILPTSEFVVLNAVKITMILLLFSVDCSYSLVSFDIYSLLTDKSIIFGANK